MKAALKQVSEEFSKGNFKFAYDHFADDMEWNVIGATVIKEKDSVIEYCDKMQAEMSGAAMLNTSTISDDEAISIQGYCNYVSENNTPARVEYCDVYQFKEEKLQSIISYCIDIK